MLASLGLVCLVVAAAVRGQAPDTSTLPALAASAVLAALAVYGFQTIVALLGLVRVSGSEPLTSTPLS